MDKQEEMATVIPDMTRIDRYHEAGQIRSMNWLSS